MTGLNFNTAPRPTQQSGQEVINSGKFWPEISLNEMRLAMRIDNNVTSERLFHAAVAATGFVNGQLDDIRRRAVSDGLLTLEAVSDEQINGESFAVLRYRRAVYCYTAAMLFESYADAAATGKTADRAESKQRQAEDYRREGHYAVADLIGRQRIDSELI